MLCSDGGFRHCEDYGIKPDLIVGDLDSLDTTVPTGDIEIIKLTRQSDSDLEKTLEEAIHCEVKNVVLLCGSGGRWGHIFSMFHSMMKFSTHIYISAVLDDSIISLHTNSFSTPSFTGESVSLFTLDNAVCLESSNLRYSLSGLTLQPGTGISLSNVSEADEFSISFTGGSLFMIRDIKAIMEYGLVSYL